MRVHSHSYFDFVNAVDRSRLTKKMVDFKGSLSFAKLG